MHEARTSRKHERRSRIARGRLLVSFCQTLSRVPSVYLVVLPTNVVQLLHSFKLVSLGLDGVPLTCLGMPGWHARLSVMTLLPAVLAALCPCVAALAYVIRGLAQLTTGRGDQSMIRQQSIRERSSREQSNGSGWGRSNAERSTAAGEVVGRHPGFVRQVLLWSVRPILYITFLAFPMTASVAFQSFSCEGFDGGAYYLRADYSVRCSDVRSGYTSPPHEAIKALAWLAIGIYPCGVPALYTLLLLSQRSALLDDRPTVLTSALSFLHKDYRKAWYLWEVVEVHAPTHMRMPAARQ